MKQSKYSKRRPAVGKPYFKDDVITSKTKLPVDNCNPNIANKETMLPWYDAVIFLDDVRNISYVKLPESKKTLIARSYEEFNSVIDEVLKDELINKIFVSFDHYLDAVTRSRFTGMDCMLSLIEKAEPYKGTKRIDISGHSSDDSMNLTKANVWALEGGELGFYFNMVKG